MNQPSILVVGAGINGLVAANYLRRAGCRVTLAEKAARIGGACVSDIADIGGIRQPYALGASVLGLMQEFVFRETGLADRLETWVPDHAKFVFLPGDAEPTWIHRDPAELDREFARRWGETGRVAAFRDDEAKVVEFLQRGYRDAVPPSLDAARGVLGDTLTALWITGSARDLLDHYFTSDQSKLYMAMTVTESGPVSLSEPCTAFTLPLMDSGSIFGGYYGFVKGGIWRITEELGRINAEAGVQIRLGSSLVDVDPAAGTATLSGPDGDSRLSFDYLVLGTDPLTAARLLGDEAQLKRTEALKFRGSSGKLNLMFRNPVRWKYDPARGDSDAAFRFLFSVSTLDEFENATLKALDDGVDYEPGYMQIYCEGAAMRHLGHAEPFDRLAVFFKNFGLCRSGAELGAVEAEARELLFRYIDNPEDCVWSRLLTPRDLRSLFLFPGGNLDHTMLVGGQTFNERHHSRDPATGFYRYGRYDNVYLCGAGTYPCGSVTGTPGYMCSRQLLKSLG